MFSLCLTSRDFPADFVRLGVSTGHALGTRQSCEGTLKVRSMLTSTGLRCLQIIYNGVKWINSPASVQVDIKMSTGTQQRPSTWRHHGKTCKHVILSRHSVTSFCHVILSRRSVTSFCHVIPSRRSVTSFCHVVLSRRSVTSFRRVVLSPRSVMSFCHVVLLSVGNNLGSL
ncbi:hypothetical protein Btru_016774 [Bulinus truncatus]|nr:hypothetical protein Btru_016774 [Bulinus truncatus]